MNRPQLALSLRITWTAFWGVAAVAALIFWCRSFKWQDVVNIRIVGGSYFNFISNDALTLGVQNALTDPQIKDIFPTSRWTMVSDIYVTDDPAILALMPPPRPHWGFTYSGAPYPYLGITTPHWFQTCIAAALAIAPWRRSLRCRFSLRTLLIAITLIALGLGTIIWFTR